MKGEIYHYHTKLMMKDAYGGGKFLWHQDYGQTLNHFNFQRKRLIF